MSPYAYLPMLTHLVCHHTLTYQSSTRNYAAPELWQSLEEFRAAAIAAAAPAASRRGGRGLGRSKPRPKAAAAAELRPPTRQASTDAGWTRVPEKVRRRSSRTPHDSGGARPSGVASAAAKQQPPRQPQQQRRSAARSAPAALPATSALQLLLHPGMDVWSTAGVFLFTVTF